MWKPNALAIPFCAFALCTALSAPALAGGVMLVGDDGNRCSAELNHQVRVGPDFIEAREKSDDPETLFTFRAPDQLTVEGRSIPLNPEQQAELERYRGELHQASRDITQISLQAVEVALQGITIAMTTLAGADHPDARELQESAAQIRQRAEERFNQQGEIYTLGDPDVGDFIDDAIGTELEPKIEKLAADAAGNLAWHALKAAFTGGRSIERRAEVAAEEVEREMELRADELEQRADGLCLQLKAVDGTEQALHQLVPELEPFDLVEVK